MNLTPDKTKDVIFTLKRKDFHQVDNNGEKVLMKGFYTIYAGGAMFSSRKKELVVGFPFCFWQLLMVLNLGQVYCKSYNRMKTF